MRLKLKIMSFLLEMKSKRLKVKSLSASLKSVAISVAIMDTIERYATLPSAMAIAENVVMD